MTSKAPPVTRDLAAVAPPVRPGGLLRRGSSGHDGVRAALAQPARPLEPELRSGLGARRGSDFGHVRVHADDAAAASAAQLGADAYTVGSAIVFGAGRYKPGSPAGRRLIAHELAHVGQQPGHSATLPDTLPVDPSPAAERSARAAGEVGAGARDRGALAGPAIQRQTDEGPKPKGATTPPAVEKTTPKDDQHKSQPAPKPTAGVDPAPAKDDAHKAAPAPTLPAPQPGSGGSPNLLFQKHLLTLPGMETPPYATPGASAGLLPPLPPLPQWVFDMAPKENPDAWFARDLTRSPLLDKLPKVSRKWILDWAKGVKFHPPDSPSVLPPWEGKQPEFDPLKGQHMISGPTFKWDFPWEKKGEK